MSRVFQNDEPQGFAVKRDGSISLRTASHRPEAAMINGLVLFGDLNAWETAHMGDEEIRRQWDRMTADEPGRYEVVEVLCTEIHRNVEINPERRVEIDERIDRNMPWKHP